MASMLQVQVRAWDIDLSRRKLAPSEVPPPSDNSSSKSEYRSGLSLAEVFNSSLIQAKPDAELSIVLTEKGFVPSSLIRDKLIHMPTGVCPRCSL